MLHLPVKIGLYVPSTNYETEIEPADFIARIKHTRHLFSNWFSGGTILNYAQGFWLGPDKKVISDNIAIVYSNTSHETLDRQAYNLFSYVSNCFVDWQQYSISLELNGQLLLFDPEDSIYDFADAFAKVGINPDKLADDILQKTEPLKSVVTTEVTDIKVLA